MKLSTVLCGLPLAAAFPGVPVPASTIEKRADDIFNATSVTGAFVAVLDAVEEVAKAAVKKTSPKVVSKHAKFAGWKDFKANGVNLGGWLSLEKGIDPAFFNDNGASEAIDEDSFCAVLGKNECGRLLEQRYASYFTEKDVDIFASYGVNTLRVPVGYWAFMPAIAGDNYYTGGQLSAFSALAKYAVNKGMHIIVDLHGLPGGQNGLDNQGKTGQLEWWNSTTHYTETLKLVDLATKWITKQPHKDQFTLGLINEPLPYLYQFGQVDWSFDYLNKYYTDALAQIRKTTKTMPVMFSDGFSGPQTWDQWWANSTQNIVFDTHIYFFTGGSYSYDAPYGACYLAKSYQVATNPVFIGEWSIQASEFNHAGDDTRKVFFDSQFSAYTTFLNGGAFWNGKHNGTNIVGDDGTDQTFYWSWQKLASEGIVPKAGETVQTLC
ncbi:hypothetical protein LTR17_016730 [Elasticomyces elasticus]|nr:hypothetical protein LTR17_016730 [Elasticomyces elasticus]